MLKWFETRVDPFRPEHDARPLPAGVWAFVAEALRPMRGVIAVALVLSAAAAIAEVLLFHYVQRIVDLTATASPATIWAEHGTELLLIAFVALVLRPLVEGLSVVVNNLTFLTPVAAMVRWRAHRRVLRQSMGFFQDDFAGRLAQRIVTTGPAVGDGTYVALDALFYAFVYALGALVLMAGLDWRLLAVFALWLAAYVGIAAWVIPRTGVRAHAVSEARSAMTGRIVDAYANIATVKLFAHTDAEDAYAKEAVRRTWTTFRDEMRLFVSMELMLLAINTALIGAVGGLGLWLWSVGEIGGGAIAAAAALVLRLSAMTGWIMWSLTQFFSNMGTAAEGVESIAAPVAVTDAPDAPALRVTEGAIRFEDVRFSYGREGGAGVDGVDLAIPPGQRVGLVGRSGAGKSTLVNLLLRFHDLEGGRILVDGQDIAGVTQDSLRAAISVVTQDTALLHRSVRENLLYGRADADEAMVEAAVARAKADGFIPDLRDADGNAGLDARVGERGVKLSGGQRQRIALARAILKDAPVLVLDEATSALDSEVEAAIQSELEGLMAGKTVIAIAHRLSTIAHLDRIVVMDEGRIVEDGTHAELIARGGLYAGFWQRQSGGFLGVAAQ